MTLNIDGIGTQDYRLLNLPLINRELVGAQFIDIDVWEQDGSLFNGDDDFDLPGPGHSNPILTQANVPASVPGEWWTLGDATNQCPAFLGDPVHCTWFNVPPTSFWRQVSFRAIK